MDYPGKLGLIDRLKSITINIIKNASVAQSGRARDS